jgi:outer membrane receptor for ferrienterochelin and colicins
LHQPGPYFFAIIVASGLEKFQGFKDPQQPPQKNSKIPQTSILLSQQFLACYSHRKMTYRFAVCLLFLGISVAGHAQNALRVKVVDVHTYQNLPGANVIETATSIGGSTNNNGVADLTNLPPGPIRLKVSFVGYRDTLVSASIPYSRNELLVGLLPLEEKLDEIIVSSTRTNARIEDLPLKVEVLGQAEMDEESTLVPGNIASLLGDLAVITIQRTSPLNGNDAIRMQGLDPQYTLITRDGLPLYGGFSGSLGVLSIPPLDLKQVEIIKGSVSTLYGGGAIAGMINFLSKEPTDTPQRTLLFNATTLKEKNLNTFFSGRVTTNTGYTLFAGANLKSAVDVNDDGFSEVPDQQNFIVHPRLFFRLGEKNELNVGLTSTVDNRRTGDIAAVKNQPSSQHPYLVTEKTFRNVLDAQYNHSWTPTHVFSFKTAVSSYKRDLMQPVRFIPDFRFTGTQYASYSEVSDRNQLGKHTVVLGANLITESLRKSAPESVFFDNYDYVTIGLFVQDDWQLTEKFSIETGFRIDHHNFSGYFPLPRIALFYKANEKLSFRLASGAGYKPPNILSMTDPDPTVVNNGGQVKGERSVGINADINYNVIWFDEVEVSLNQAFYLADIKNPLRVISDTVNRSTYLENQNYRAKTYGTDTYAQLVYGNWELYLGYNHTAAYQDYAGGKNAMPFNPRDKFSTTLAYSVEKKWRTGIEASFMANQFISSNVDYFGSQTIYQSTRVPDFWFWAAMVERKFSFGSIVLNVENLFDARQSKFQPLYDGPVTSPEFRPVWAPLDGRVFNLSVKVNL